MKIPKIIQAATNLELADGELIMNNSKKCKISPKKKKESKNSIYAMYYGRTRDTEISYPNSPALSNPANPKSPTGRSKAVATPVIKPSAI